MISPTVRSEPPLARERMMKRTHKHRAAPRRGHTSKFIVDVAGQFICSPAIEFRDLAYVPGIGSYQKRLFKAEDCLTGHTLRLI